MDSAASPELHDPALRAQVIAGLERLIWEPQPGVSDLDRVEAVQVLGQFRDPAARQALARLLYTAARSLPPLGRLLRDTALDTLLRSPAQRGATTDRLLAGYYSFWGRIRRRRLERNVIYDDLPLLVRRGRAGLVLRAYVLPLLLTLLVLVLLPGLVSAPLQGAGLGWLDWLLGAGFFLALGLLIFNLHQVLLVLLVAFAGARLALPAITGRRRKAVLGGVLAGAGAGLALAAILLILRNAAGFNAASLRGVIYCLLALPLPVIPSYMLAHDLESGAGASADSRLAWVAVALRVASGAIYVAYVLAAFGLNFLVLTFTIGGEVGDGDVLLASLPYWLYLLVAPIVVVAVLAALGWLQRRGRARLPAAGVPA